MNGHRLFTITTVALQLLVAGLFGSTALGQTPTGLPSGFGVSLDPIKQQCATALAGVMTASSAVFTYCRGKSDMKKCATELEDCRKEASKQSVRIMGGDDDDLGDTGDADCTRINKIREQCPGLYQVPPEEAERNKKDLRQVRDDLRKDRKEMRNDAQDKLKQAQDDNNKMDDDALKNDEEYRKNRKEITDKLQKDLADIDDAKLKSLKQAQDDYDKIDVEYIRYRDQLRRKTSAANDTELTWNTQCLAAADDVAQKTEAAFDQRMAAEDAMVRNFQMSSSAGKMNRRLKLKRQKILNKYNEFLAKCMRGNVEPGAGLKLKLSQTKNDLRDSSAEATDRAARLEKLRLQILDNLNQLKQSLDKKTQMLVQQSQEALQMLDQDHQQQANRLQQRKSQAMMQQMMQNTNQGQQQQETNDRINELQKEEAAASAQYKCWAKGDKEQISSDKKERQEAQSALSTVHLNCKKSFNERQVTYEIKPLGCGDDQKLTGADAEKICRLTEGLPSLEGRTPRAGAGANTNQ